MTRPGYFSCSRPTSYTIADTSSGGEGGSEVDRVPVDEFQLPGPLVSLLLKFEICRPRVLVTGFPSGDRTEVKGDEALVRANTPNLARVP